MSGPARGGAGGGEPGPVAQHSEAFRVWGQRCRSASPAVAGARGDRNVYVCVSLCVRACVCIYTHTELYVT